MRCVGRMGWLAGLLTLTTLCTMAVFSMAEEVDYTEFSLAELLQTDVVYGASKFEQETKDAPASVTIVTAEEIRGFGYRTLAEVLASVRGFYTTYDRNYQYAGARGFGRPGDYNSRILLLIDGVRTNDNVYDSASLGNGALVDLSLVKQVEIVRGPSSSLYGTSAIFAIVNVITKSPHEYGGVEATGRTGSFGGIEGQMTIAQGAEQELQWQLTGSVGHLDGQDLYFPEFDDPQSNRGLFADGDRSDWQNLFGKLIAGSFHFEGAYAWSDKHVPTAPWETVFNDSRTMTTDNQGYVSGWYDGAIGAQTQLLARVSYNSYRYEGTWAYDYADEGEEPRLVLNKDNAKSNWLTTEAQITRQFDGGHMLAVGGEYRFNFRQDQAVWDEDPYWSYTDDKRDTDNSGLYALGEWRVSEQLRFHLGVRRDTYSTFGSSTNPRLAALLTPRPGSLIKAIYGSAFRAPNMYELFYSDGDETTKANPDLQPETIRTTELAFEQSLGESMYGSLSLFKYHNKHLIEQIEDPTDSLLVYINNDEVKATGLELELRTQSSSGLKSVTSYSYSKATTLGNDELLTNSPQHMVKFKVLVPLRTITTSAGLEVQYYSSRRTVRGSKTDGYVLANLTVVHAPLESWLELAGGVYNVFDTSYFHPGGTEHLQPALEQDGRSYRFSIIVRP